MLAGGLGTRLAPLTDALPKPLAPVLNYPLIGHVLGGLRRAGVRDIGVTVRPYADQLRGYLGDGRQLGVNLTWLQDTALVGTGGSLRDHAWFFEDEPALVVTADMLSDIDLPAVIRHHRTHPAAVTVVVHPVDLATWPGDIVDTDRHHGLVYQFKPGPDRALSNLGSTGTWIVDPAILDDLPAGHLDFSSDVLPHLPTDHRSLGVYDAGPTRLRDFGQFDTYHQGNLEALVGHHAINPAGTLVGPRIWTEPGTRIDPNATLTGPLAIGHDATIGPGARLTGPSIIGHDATIGARAAVHRSVVLPAATIPHDTLVANAVIGDPNQVLASLLAHPMPAATAGAPARAPDPERANDEPS